jgi:hypothetical protein
MEALQNIIYNNINKIFQPVDNSVKATTSIPFYLLPANLKIN